MRALRSSNELQQFLRIIQPLLELRTESLRGNLRRNGNVACARIRRDKSDFIDPYCGLFIVSKSVLDLLDDILGLGTAHGECPHQARKIIHCDLVGKVNAG